jgi:predicted dehydrogenase
MMELLNVPGVEYVAVCDNYGDRAEKGADLVEQKTGRRPKVYQDYRELFAREELDAVLCCTTWVTHGEIAIAAMNAGCHVAIEVGGAASAQECWDMVKTSERTGKFCMLLENCCYDRNEMAVLNIVRQGLMGEIVHCAGGYRHDLRDEIAYGKENHHGRLKNFLARNGELYPTHELGPIAKLLHINRGNRFLSLVSVASKARGMADFLHRKQPADYYLQGAQWNEGDIVDTLITCANGETIHLTHDCTLPRFYSRDYAVQGTRGLYQESAFGNALMIDEEIGTFQGWNHRPANFDDYRAVYEHPLWKAYEKGGIHANGHGGMDYLVLSAFADAVEHNTLPPIDVYDTAAWMAITYLSEQSIAMGGQPVPVPDFTNGAWIEREPAVPSIFSCEEIYPDLFAADTALENSSTATAESVLPLQASP